MKRILIVNQNWIGDVLFSTPAIRAVRKNFPDAYLACLVPDRCRPVLANNPHLNQVLTYDERMPLFSPFKIFSLAGRLRRGQFDIAIFFHRSKTKAAIAALAGIPDRAGYARSLWKNFLTRAVPLPARSVHKVDYFLFLLTALGLETDGRQLDFFPAEGARSRLAELLREAGADQTMPYAVVHAGGNWRLKRWPAAYFAEWIRKFLPVFPGFVILCGTSDEAELAAEIVSRVSDRRVVSLCGKTSLDTLAMLLAGAAFILTNDSGPMHLAASQKTPVAALFGPTSPELTGPVSEAPVLILRKDVGCEIPCYYRHCDTRLCMDWLTPEEVFDATRHWEAGLRSVK